jgi:hypothetical protein
MRALRIAGPSLLRRNKVIIPIPSGSLLRHRHCGKNLKFQIDPRTRQLIRNARHLTVDVASRKHRQHLIAKLFDKFAIAKSDLTRRTVCNSYRAPNTADRWARILSIPYRCKRIELKICPREFIGSAISTDASTRGRFRICTRACRDQERFEFTRKPVARIGRRESKVLKTVFVRYRRQWVPGPIWSATRGPD